MKFKIILINFLLISNIVFAQENTPISCSDGIDNDGDGAIDCLDNECATLPNNGCSTCFNEGLSFADFVIEYSQNCTNNLKTNPQTAIGVSNFADADAFDEYVSLGSEGYIKLGFNNNLLTNSGDNNSDLWVFEIGPAVESSQIDLKPYDQNTIDILVNEGIQDNDSDGYFEFDVISGSTSSLDIDAYLIGYSPSALKFDAVKITNATNMPCGTETTPGADIDAICALSYIAIDCAGTQDGTAQIDDCGQCLETNNPNFNSCIDCAGTQNGTALIDQCGQCLIPNDPEFNTCIDCAGTQDGTAIIDQCEQCLEPNDPSFNLSCIDCTGIINGTALIDQCGQCLIPNDPEFNACLDCAGIQDGIALIDQCGQCLEPNDPNFNISCLDCAGIINGTNQIDGCGECLDINNDNFNLSCILIPNAFSPNNDGINDNFRIFAKDGLSPTIKLYQIYNRWGGLVYQANEFMVNSNNYWWNGDFKGQKSEIGVFVYYFVVLFENGEQKSFKGNITLIR